MKQGREKHLQFDKLAEEHLGNKVASLLAQLLTLIESDLLILAPTNLQAFLPRKKHQIDKRFQALDFPPLSYGGPDVQRTKRDSLEDGLQLFLEGA